MSTTQKKYRDEDWLRTEYVEKERSLTDIADELGCGSSTVSRWLKKNNIKTREPAETLTSGNTKKLHDRSWLEKEYTKKEKSSYDIANELDCSKETVLYWLKKHNIERRQGHEALTDGDTKKLRNKSWLKKQYAEKQRTSIDIADELNVSNTTICRWLERHDIEVNNYGDTKKLQDEDWLRTEYVEKERPAPHIANELGCCSETVYRWLEKHDIHTRSAAESKTNGNIQKLKDKNWLKKQYVGKERSAYDIADKINCTSATIYRWLERHDIERRKPVETRSYDTPQKLRDSGWLAEQYIDKEKSSLNIADELDCAQSAVLNWLEKHNIETRGVCGTKDSGNTSKLRDKQWLKQEYIEKEKSSLDIADELGCHKSTVLDWLHKHEIKIEKIYEACDVGNTEKLQDKEWLIGQYVENERTAVSIANELSCSRGSVYSWLRNHGIEIKSKYDYYQSVEDVPDHIDHKIRSSWELEVAEMLINNDVDYEYESMEIEYGDRTYIPDFITDDYIIEVKGWVRGNDERQKAETTMKKIDDKKYVVVGSELPCDIHIDWENNSELVELFT